MSVRGPGGEWPDMDVFSRASYPDERYERPNKGTKSSCEAVVLFARMKFSSNLSAQACPDVTEKIQAMINNACAEGSYCVHLPHGRYCVRPNVLSDLPRSVIRRGLRFIGEAGPYRTVLKLLTGGEQSWFYDNGRVAVMERVSFENLGFYADNPKLGNGFRLSSRGGEKLFQFFNCAFGTDVAEALDDEGGLHTFFRSEGTGNADQLKVTDTHFDLSGDLLYLNNPQSVGHLLKGVSGIVRGNLVRIGDAGGGCVDIHGGVFDLYPGDTKEEKFILNIPNSKQVDIGNGTFAFSGVRFELRDKTKGIVNLPDRTGHVSTLFSACNFGTVLGGGRVAIRLNTGKAVTLDTCMLHEDLTYEFVGARTDASPQNGGVLEIRSCNTGLASTDLTDRIRFDAIKPAGRAIGRGNHGRGARAFNHRIAQDFDVGAFHGIGAEPSATVKIACLCGDGDLFPNGSNAIAITLCLPVGALLRRIVVEKSGAQRVSEMDEDPYQLAVSNGDGTVVYSMSKLGPQSQRHFIDASPGLRLYTLNERIIRLYATYPSRTQRLEGYAYAEYI